MKNENKEKQNLSAKQIRNRNKKNKINQSNNQKYVVLE